MRVQRAATAGATLFDPLDVLAEVLGEPAGLMRNPANADYRCPFITRECVKFNRTLGTPQPVCSVYRHDKGGNPQSQPPICTCPKRFFAADIVEDVIRECWVGKPPVDPAVVHEVGMGKFGTVDLVIADVEAGSRVRTFVPVELQAVDITGSVLPYYEALIASQHLSARKAYNFNWANVRKRFISQLIAKGYYCHHWGTRIVAVVQEDLFDSFHRHARLSAVSLQDSTIVFLLYQYVRVGDGWEFRFRRTVPTTHSAVMNAVLYETPPSRVKFEAKLLGRLRSL